MSITQKFANIAPTLKNVISGALALTLIACVLAATFSTLYDIALSIRKTGEYRSYLLEQAKKSSAHNFLVTNWIQCTPAFTSRASCYAGIRESAKAKGAKFVAEVDAAAKEMDLI